MRLVHKVVRRIQNCVSWSELTGQEVDVGVYKWRRSQGTGTGGGGGLRESWTGRGGTEDHTRGRGECVLRTIPSISCQHQ